MILAECDRLYMCRARVKIATSVCYITCVHTIYLPYFTCTCIYEGTKFFLFYFIFYILLVFKTRFFFVLGGFI